MSWADPIIERLKTDQFASFRPKGNSMRPLIYSCQLVTVTPRDRHLGPLEKGLVVLVTVGSRTYLHLIHDVRGEADDREYLIGNNRGGRNGWVGTEAIHGVKI